MPIEELPIFCYYDVQRFTQFGSMDCANWYGISVEAGKKKQALYPTMGRKHVRLFNQNKFIFTQEPRQIFRTIDYVYFIVGSQVIQGDRFFNQRTIGTVSILGNIWFAFLPVQTTVIALMTDGINIFEIVENGSTTTFNVVTDPNAPGGANNPGSPAFIGAFGNRFVVSLLNTPTFSISTVTFAGGTTTGFTILGAPLNATATGIIRQIGVLGNQMYIFNDYTTDIWANIISQITVAGATFEFPFKLNTSTNWDYGIEDPFSLDVDFARMVWLAKNADGLVSFVISNGQYPQDISSQAINVLLENSRQPDDELSPFLTSQVDGFLYQYENTIFYRVSAGPYMGFLLTDINVAAHSIEYNFATGKWGRCIELNGERNRIRFHVYFNNTHLVSVIGDPAVYEMAGNIYHNELINPAQPNNQAVDAFLKYPMRYELVTQHIFLPDYAEFIDDYIEIDFVFGDKTFYQSNAPYLNTVFVVTEDSTPAAPVYVVTEDDAFVITEDGNTPAFDDNHYNILFKPYLELQYSDDGGITYTSADLRLFSPLGQYRWRMRWYELSSSRNRCYKLICVSSAPIVVLGGVRSTRRISGGAN